MTIEVVLSCDENYLPFAAVTVFSTIVHCQAPEKLNFSLITPGLSKHKRIEFERMVVQYGAQIRVIEADTKPFSDLNLRRFGVASILRLLIANYLPNHYERALYLDCDILVLDDLSPLWNARLGHASVGAVTDLTSPVAFEKRCQIHSKYFNSGVLLIDLVHWRKEEIGEKVLQFLTVNLESLSFYDQDALNYIIGDNWHSLDLRWNFQPAAYSAFDKNYNYLQERRDELEAAIRKPAVVHFIGGTKPWHARCRHPLQDLFLFYSQFTPWPIDKQALRSQLTFYERAKRLLRLPKQWRRQQMLDYKKPDFVALERL